MRISIISVFLILSLVITSIIALNTNNPAITPYKAASISWEATCMSLYQKVGQLFCGNLTNAKKGLAKLRDMIVGNSLIEHNLHAQINNFLHLTDDYTDDSERAQTFGMLQSHADSQCAELLRLKKTMTTFLISEKKLFAAHDAYVSLLNNVQTYSDNDAQNIIKHFKSAWLELKQKIDTLNTTLATIGVNGPAFDLAHHYSDIEGSLLLHNE